MAGFELRERIAAPAEKVFALLSDPARIRTWVPEIQELEVIGGGPVRQGARLRERRTVMGRQGTTELEVRSYDPPRRYVVANSTSGIETIYDYRLTPDGDDTDVWLAATVNAGGLRKALAAVAARMLKRQDGDQLARLKVAAEGR